MYVTEASAAGSSARTEVLAAARKRSNGVYIFSKTPVEPGKKRSNFDDEEQARTIKANIQDMERKAYI